MQGTPIYTRWQHARVYGANSALNVSNLMTGCHFTAISTLQQSAVDQPCIMIYVVRVPRVAGTLHGGTAGPGAYVPGAREQGEETEERKAGAKRL